MADLGPLNLNPFDNGAFQSPERMQRMARIGPLLPAIKNSVLPPISKEGLIELMTDLKEEGNDNFKEKNYRYAGDYYTCALIVAKMLQVHHFHNISQDNLAVFFSNRAACCQKMDMFDQAVSDCDSAISLNPSAVKSFYRKAIALKSVQKYTLALEVIEEGIRRSVQYNKVADGEELKKVKLEIMAIMNMQSETPLSSMKWGISQPFVQPIGQSIGQPIDQSIVQPAGQPTVVQSQQPVKQREEPSVVSQTFKPPASQSSQASNKSAKGRKKKGKPQKYTGTLSYLQNVQGMSSSSSSGEEENVIPETSSDAECSSEEQEYSDAVSQFHDKQKQNASATAVEIQHQVQTTSGASANQTGLQTGASANQTGLQTASPWNTLIQNIQSQQTIAGPQQSTTIPQQQTSARQAGGAVKQTQPGQTGSVQQTSGAKQVISQPPPQPTSKQVTPAVKQQTTSSQANVKQPVSVSQKQTPASSASQAKQTPASNQQVKQTPASSIPQVTVSKQSTSLDKSDLQNVSHQSVTTSQSIQQQSSAYFSQTAPATNKFAALANLDGFTMGEDLIAGHSTADVDSGRGRSSLSSNLSDKSTLSNVPSQSSTPLAQVKDYPVLKCSLPAPYDSYDLTLACIVCYRKLREGPNGYQPVFNDGHRCSFSTLLVRNPTTKIWTKVRPRPQSQILGSYKKCAYFLSSRPCAAGEDLCGFAHNDDELQFWTLEKKDQVNIYLLMNELRQTLISGHQFPSQNNNQYSMPHPRFVPPQRQPLIQPHAVPLMSVHMPASFGTVIQPGLLGATPMMRGPAQLNYLPMQRPPVFAVPPPRMPQPRVPLAQQQPFPLAMTHIFRLACETCLKPTRDVGLFSVLNVNHSCSENMLVVCVKGDSAWVKIRERNYHENIRGGYILCRSVSENRLCTAGDNKCNFAHNEEELYLWNLEKNGQFIIKDFITSNRKIHQGVKGPTGLDAFLSKYRGQFVFICRSCWFGRPPRMSVQSTKNSSVCAANIHSWVETECILAYRDLQGHISTINKRGFKHRGAVFQMCHYQLNCKNRREGFCKFAHGPVEMDVWQLEHDYNVSQAKLVELSTAKFQAPPPPVFVSPAAGSQPSMASRSQPTMASAAGSSTSTTQQQTRIAPQPASSTGTKLFPFNIIEACESCWRQGKQVCVKDETRDRCNSRGIGHNWSINARVYLTQPGNKELRLPPRKFPQNLEFVLCWDIQNKGRCTFRGAVCQFAHSKEEIMVWKWMISNKVKTIAEVYQRYRSFASTQPAAANKQEEEKTRPIQTGETVISIQESATGSEKSSSNIQGMLGSESVFLCQYCNVQCNSERQWDEHCASQQHMFNVNSDRDHQWNYRQPPWGVPAGNYKLCEQHNAGLCRYTSVPEMYNLCKFAHSQLELDEWKERWEWRQMKKDMAKLQGVYSYMEALLEDYEEAELAMTVMAEDLKGVSVECSESMAVYNSDKASEFSWIFKLHSQGEELVKVALLHNRDRLHFQLVGEGIEEACQIAPGNLFQKVDDEGAVYYEVEVYFTGGMFGSFMQWVAFDFGKRPVLVQKLNVELGSSFVQEKVERLREKLKFDRWTGENREIVKASRSVDEDELMMNLLKQYKAPTSVEAVITQQSIGIELNRHNYVHKMHKLLYIEEFTKHKLIASFNLETEVELTNRIESGDGPMIIAHQGELFARVQLTDSLNEDTDTGKLILTSVTTVLLTLLNTSNVRVYEAHFVNKEDFDYDGRGRDYIYLCLQPRCVQELSLQEGETVAMEIQFQLDRQPFCEMHYALDKLHNVDIVFPDLSKIDPSWALQPDTKISSRSLNEEQLQVVQHTLRPETPYCPPLIVNGPFGTGKTETLAQATQVLVSQRPGSRVLICTYTNSASDLYVTKYFDPFRQKSYPNLKMIRIYYVQRRMSTISEQIRAYCLLSPNGKLRQPTKDDVVQAQIVLVTLKSALYLTKLEASGLFTHIFVDEATQGLECEVLMPLLFAREKTRIIIAGDHMQVTAKVYSAEARRQKFNMSILERLFRHYDNYEKHAKLSRPLHILLTKNYRTKKEILRYLSASFYGGPDVLLSRSVVPEVRMSPLMFYTAVGREVQDETSTSFYNIAEAEEVAERVKDLFDNWPSEWGPRKAESIAVVTCYNDQVIKIRYMLRKKKNLTQVYVGNVYNIQGREFRAIFVSAVRTRHLTEHKYMQPNTLTSDGSDDIVELGFLSDRRLLNTAFSRAQSFVAVIGDPVGLCALGRCQSDWRTYLKHCQNMRSIFPTSVTLDTVRAQVVAFVNSPAGQQFAKLYEVPEEDIIIPKRRGKPVEETTGRTNVWKRSQTSNTGDDTTVAAPLPEDSEDFANADGRYFEEWSKTHVINVEQVMCQILSEAMGRSVTYSEIEVREEDEHAVLSLTSKPSTSRVEELAKEPLFVEKTEKELSVLLQRSSDRYKKCRLHIQRDCAWYATTEDHSVSQRILLASSRDCGRAVDGDLVVVELLLINKEETETKVWGRVVGVLASSLTELKHRLLVCSARPNNAGLLTPISTSYPHIYNLETHAKMSKSRKGYASIYVLTKSGEVKFHCYEKIDSSSEKKLFLVMYLKWDVYFDHPFGIVVGILSSMSNLNTSLVALNIQYGIPSSFSSAVEKEIQQKYPTTYKITNLPSGIKDLSNKLSFAVGEKNSGSMDCALGVESMPGGQGHLVFVHVADVSYFVPMQSEVEREALQRTIRVNPMSLEPIQMLPLRLSDDLCSFETCQQRLAVTVVMVVDTDGRVSKCEVKRTLIKCKLVMELGDIEMALHEQQPSAAEAKAIHVLYDLVKKWRFKRLGNELLCSLTDSETPLADQLMTEITIMASHQVALLLTEKYGDAVPLVVQLPPLDVERLKWCKRFSTVATETMSLTRLFLDEGKICRCRNLCTCLLDEYNLKNDTIVWKRVWLQVRHALTEGNVSLIQQLLLNEHCLPIAHLARNCLLELIEEPLLCCSGDVTNWFVFEQNMSVSTQFLSPVTSFIGLVVQRLLIALSENKQVPYNQFQIAEFCTKINRSERRLREYEKEMKAAQVALSLHREPRLIDLFVEAIDVDQLVLRAVDKNISGLEKMALGLSALALNDVANDDAVQMLTWQVKIYDANVGFITKQTETLIELTSLPRCVTIDNEVWQNVLSSFRSSVLTSDSSSVLEKVFLANEVVNMDSSEQPIVSSEGLEYGRMGQTISAKLNVDGGAILRGQAVGKSTNGVMVVQLQLVCVSQQFDICIEHHQQPANCFASPCLLSAARPMYVDELQYRNAWLPAVALESAVASSAMNNSYIIHNVSIKWNRQNPLKGPTYVGSFTLPWTFCHERRIVIGSGWSADGGLMEDFVIGNEIAGECISFDYACVRYARGPSNSANEEAQYFWIGHCLVTQIKVDKIKNMVTVHLCLQQSTLPYPDDLIDKQPVPTATVEWIVKKQDARYMETAVQHLDRSSNIVKEIALGRNIQPLGMSTIHVMEEISNLPIPHLAPSSEHQSLAINQALTQSFTVLKGPAGCGKTLTAVKIAYLFSQANNKASDKMKNNIGPQVLFCSTSMRSLDTATGYFLQLKDSCPLVIRVYNEQDEQIEYPPPPNLYLTKTTKSAVPAVTDMALHRIIRKADENVAALDAVISGDKSRNWSREEADAYLQMIREAERKQLQCAQIILCHPSQVMEKRLLYNTNFRQIIIDDCNQCAEPMALSAMVTSSIEQVVLLGDNQSIQPLVHNDSARNLGMLRSLFERYSDKSVSLDTQFRMHEGIAMFPSLHYYGGAPKCGKEELLKMSSLKLWPAGTRNKPIAFVNTVSNTNKCVAVTDFGSTVASFANHNEASLVARMAINLVRKYSIRPRDIAILTPYEAQEELICKALKLKEQQAITVSLCHKSQGAEWDYVLVSTVHSLPKNIIPNVKPNQQWLSNNLGRIINAGEINVAITRARKGMIIFGDQNLLCCDPVWKKLLSHYEALKKVIFPEELV